MYFDPATEVPMVRDLTEDEKRVRIDTYASVSELDEDEDGFTLDDWQHNLFPVGIPHGT